MEKEIKFRDYLLRQKYLIATNLIIKFIGTVMDLIIPLILAYIIDDIAPTKIARDIYFWGFIMFLCTGIGFLFNIIANSIANYISSRVTKQIRTDLFDKLLTLSPSQVDHISQPSLVLRLTSDTYNVQNMVGIFFRIGIRAPIIIIGGMIFTFSINFKLATILLLLQPIVFLTLITTYKKGLPLYEKKQKSSDNLVRTLRENISGIRIIKALGKSSFEQQKFSNFSNDAIRNDKKPAKLWSLNNRIVAFVFNAGSGIIVLLGAFLVNDGEIEKGIVMAFLSYFTMIVMAVNSSGMIFMRATEGFASFRRIKEVLMLPKELKLLSKNEPTALPNHPNAHIEFKNVCFSYYGVENNLENINFSLDKGQSLGIIGSTGSGKSTIIKLLLRLYDVSSGNIFINGKDIRTIDPTVFYKNFGVVFQNDMIFSGSIRENIDFHREINDGNLLEASKIAMALDFIQNSDEKFDRLLSPRGTNISGGQRQRTYIGRAVASKPEILILDDSSSALDNITEKGLRNNLENELKSTKIIISQKIASLKNLDKIMVITDGKISAIGNHEELLNISDEYRNIYKVQEGGISESFN